MRQTLGIAEASAACWAVVLFGIFLTPVFFYVSEWFSELWPFNTPAAKHAGRMALNLLTMVALLGDRLADWHWAVEIAGEQRPEKTAVPRLAVNQNGTSSERLNGDSHGQSPTLNGKKWPTRTAKRKRRPVRRKFRRREKQGAACSHAFHQSPIFASALSIVIARRPSPVHAADRPVHRNHAADRTGFRLLSRRQRPDCCRHRGGAN